MTRTSGILGLLTGLAGAARAQELSPAANDSLRRALAAQDIAVESVVGVHRTARHILVDTHINPSAGTLVVLSPTWQPVTKLPGWMLRALPNDLVLYHHNSVHFAPTRWAELWTWDPTTKREARLYPAADRLKVAERSGSRLGDTVVVSKSGRTAAFIVSYGGEGPSPTKVEDVAVTCTAVGTQRSRCTEQPLTALTRALPDRSSLEILTRLARDPR